MEGVEEEEVEGEEGRRRGRRKRKLQRRYLTLLQSHQNFIHHVSLRTNLFFIHSRVLLGGQMNRFEFSPNIIVRFPHVYI